MLTERRGLSPADLKRVIEAERGLAPFLLWRRADGPVDILSLAERHEVTVGRRSTCDLVLAHDPLASRTHAKFERLGEDWLLLDDGISRNGSFVNGGRSAGYHRLIDGDRIRFGSTTVEFRNPAQGQSAVTSVPAIAQIREELTPTQRRILVALCRPYREGGPYATPASNPEIAREVYLGVDAVKAHLREMYRRFDINLPQNQKRARLAEHALQLGLTEDR